VMPMAAIASDAVRDATVRRLERVRKYGDASERKSDRAIRPAAGRRSLPSAPSTPCRGAAAADGSSLAGPPTLPGSVVAATPSSDSGGNRGASHRREVRRALLRELLRRQVSDQPPAMKHQHAIRHAEHL